MELKRNTLNETKDMNEYKNKTEEGTKVTPLLYGKSRVVTWIKKTIGKKKLCKTHPRVSWQFCQLTKRVGKAQGEFRRIMRLGRTIYNQRKWEENKITGGRTGAIL